MILSCESTATSAAFWWGCKTLAGRAEQPPRGQLCEQSPAWSWLSLSLCSRCARLALCCPPCFGTSCPLFPYIPAAPAPVPGGVEEFSSRFQNLMFIRKSPKQVINQAVASSEFCPGSSLPGKEVKAGQREDVSVEQNYIWCDRATVGWRIPSQNEKLEPGVGDNVLPLCLSFPFHGKGGLIWSAQS